MECCWERLLLACALGTELLVIGNCRFRQNVPDVRLYSSYLWKYLEKCFRSILGFELLIKAIFNFFSVFEMHFRSRLVWKIETFLETKAGISR